MAAPKHKVSKAKQRATGKAQRKKAKRLAGVAATAKTGKRGRKAGFSHSSTTKAKIKKAMSLYWSKSPDGKARRKNCKARGCPNGAKRTVMKLKKAKAKRVEKKTATKEEKPKAKRKSKGKSAFSAADAFRKRYAA